LSLAALVASGAYGSYFWIARDRGAPAESFAPAAEHLRAKYREGDAIFLYPFYATRGREYLGDLNPLAVRDPLAEDLDVHPRVWVLAQYGEGVALREKFSAAGLKLLESTGQKGITVDLYETGARRKTTYRFRDHFKKASVYHEKDGTNTPCVSWSETNGQGGALGGKWTCPYDQEWFYVAPEWHRMGETPRLCFWAHPPSQGRLVVRFPNVPLSGHLYGRAGHTLNGSVHARAPIHFDVEVQPEPSQRFTFELTDYFEPFMMRTPSTGTATVTFAVSTPDAGTNHFCFDVEMRAEVTP
jgi:hypothetical protein